MAGRTWALIPHFRFCGFKSNSEVLVKYELSENKKVIKQIILKVLIFILQKQTICNFSYKIVLNKTIL